MRSRGQVRAPGQGAKRVVGGRPCPSGRNVKLPLYNLHPRSGAADLAVRYPENTAQQKFPLGRSALSTRNVKTLQDTDG